MRNGKKFEANLIFLLDFREASLGFIISEFDLFETLETFDPWILARSHENRSLTHISIPIITKMWKYPEVVFLSSFHNVFLAKIHLRHKVIN